MAQFDLNIRCSNIDEFSDIARRLCVAPAAAMNGTAALDTDEDEQSDEQGGTEVAEKPKRTRRTKAGQEPRVPTQEPDGKPIPPISEPVPQPTPGGTDAPPAESIPPNQGAATVDVFTPAAGAAEAPAAAEGEVSVQHLKDAMADLLKIKSAGFAMKTLEDATGCKSLSSGSPSVTEKAKTDPAIMRVALDALVAGKTAA